MQVSHRDCKYSHQFYFQIQYSYLELGVIEFSVEYIESLLQIKVHLMNATNLVSKDSNGLSDPYIKLHLLPGIAKVRSNHALECMVRLHFYLLICGDRRPN